MLKSNLHLFQELSKLRDQACCLNASINGHDGTVSVHLPLLVAANPWIGNCIDHRDSVHESPRLHPLHRQSLHQGCSRQHILPQPGVQPLVARDEQHRGVVSVPAPVWGHCGHLQGHPGPALQARGYSGNTDDPDHRGCQQPYSGS